MSSAAWSLDRGAACQRTAKLPPPRFLVAALLGTTGAVRTSDGALDPTLGGADLVERRERARTAPHAVHPLDADPADHLVHEALPELVLLELHVEPRQLREEPVG